MPKNVCWWQKIVSGIFAVDIPSGFPVGLVDDHIPWETITFIFRGYNPSLGVETSFPKVGAPISSWILESDCSAFFVILKTFFGTLQETNIFHLITSQRADDLPNFPFGYVTSSFLEGSEGSGVASDKCPLFWRHSFAVRKQMESHE